ncbi:MAG: helix-turn-helix transcriptional regulator [Anaerolineales bacterium]|nr:helix-turn-helix transcriptional regulator [Anaerolineales bacterium]
MEPQARVSTRAFCHLTRREREILEKIVSGCSNQEIAAALSLSVKTIEWHRMNLMRKLGVHKVADLVRIAIQQEIV